MKSITNFKRGDTLLLTVTYKIDGVATSVATIDIKSQVRTKTGTLISEMTVTKLGETGKFTLTPTIADTSEWPVSFLYCDIQFSESGNIRSTETFGISVTEEITQ
jgi:hypothetical protein